MEENRKNETSVGRRIKRERWWVGLGEKCSKSHLHLGRGHGVPLILDFSCLVTWSCRRYRDDTRLVFLFDCSWCQAFSSQAPLPPRSDISNHCLKICFDNQQLPDPDPISYVTRVLADNYMSLFLEGGNTRNSRHCCLAFYPEIFRNLSHALTSDARAVNITQ